MSRNESLRVLITGSSRGIGRAIADKYQKENYQVLAPTRADLDLADDRSITHYLEHVCPDGVDILINNAGINHLSGIDNFDFRALNNILNINLLAPIKLIAYLVKPMINNSRGWIVNIGSIWSQVGKEKRLPYAVSKCGINGVTKTLAVELGKYNILINSVNPGYVDTDMTKANVQYDERKVIEDFIPLKRFAEPDEVANAVFFLGSKNNTYITGHTLIVDGGYCSK